MQGSGGGNEIATLHLHDGRLCRILDRHQCAGSLCRVQQGGIESHAAGALQK